MRICGSCYHCGELVEFQQFAEDFRCWHCNRLLSPTHDCDSPDGDGGWECCDYLMPSEDDE